MYAEKVSYPGYSCEAQKKGEVSSYNWICIASVGVTLIAQSKHHSKLSVNVTIF